MTSAYIIADVNVTNARAIRAIQEVAPARNAGARRRGLVRGGQIEVLEGDWQPERLVC